jgi:hypothetical protein
MLWFTWLAANTTMWMNDVAAAWLMTSIAPSPLWVALVQSASTLPVFFLGLPSGALADILDRRRYFMATQFWVAIVATVLCGVILADEMTAPLLLALTFANGVGLAMRWPVFAAIIPEVVDAAAAGAGAGPERHRDERLAHHRPAAGRRHHRRRGQRLRVRAERGAVAGGRLHHHALAAPAPREPAGPRALTSAMRVGVQFVRQSSRMRGICCASRCSSCIPRPSWRCCRWWRAGCPAAPPAPTPSCWRPWARAPSSRR